MTATEKKWVTYIWVFFEQVAGSWAQSALRKRCDECKFVAISNPFMIGKKPRILTKATCKTVHFWMRMERYGKLIHLGVCFWPSKYGLLECTVCIKPWLLTDEWLLQWTFLEGWTYPKEQFRSSILTKQPCAVSTRKRAGSNMEIILRINCEYVWRICRQHGDFLASHGNRVCDDASLCLGCRKHQPSWGLAITFFFFRCQKLVHCNFGPPNLRP